VLRERRPLPAVLRPQLLESARTLALTFVYEIRSGGGVALGR